MVGQSQENLNKLQDVVQSFSPGKWGIWKMAEVETADIIAKLL